MILMLTFHDRKYDNGNNFLHRDNSQIFPDNQNDRIRPLQHHHLQ